MQNDLLIIFRMSRGFRANLVRHPTPNVFVQTSLEAPEKVSLENARFLNVLFQRFRDFFSIKLFGG